MFCLVKSENLQAIIMQILCKFSGTWTLLDKEKGTSKLLNQRQIEVVEELFEPELEKPAKIFDAIKIEKFPAAKLQQITIPMQAKQVDIPGKLEIGKAA